MDTIMLRGISLLRWFSHGIMPPMALIFLMLIGLCGCNTNPPESLVGEYTASEGGAVQLHVTSEGGGYYLQFENTGSRERIPMVPMVTDDQTKIGGNTVNLKLVGLKSTQGTFMLFKVDPGWQNWGETFTTGYGCYGGPFAGVEALHKK